MLCSGKPLSLSSQGPCMPGGLVLGTLLILLLYLLKSPAIISWYLLYSAVTAITAVNDGLDWIGEIVVAVYML